MRINDQNGNLPDLETLLQNSNTTPEQKQEIKRFHCESCEYSTKRKYALYSHVKYVHERVRDHICGLCGKATVSRQCLRKHMERAHATEKEEESMSQNLL